MLKFEVQFDDTEARGILARLKSRLGATEELHEAMGTAVADRVRNHIATTKKSPNTGFWARVAASVTHTQTADEAIVSVPETGAALRYYGGVVRQKPGGPLLTIPTKDVPVQAGTRLAARDMGLLAFLPSRKPGTRGVLVQGESYTKTRGRNKGKQGVRPLPGGQLYYILREMTTHQPDPTVLPTDAQVAETARDAALDYIAADLT